MAGDDNKATPPAGEKPAVTTGGANAPRKYTYIGITPRNPKASNIYGNGIKIRPWAMTDAEIDTLLQRAPELARLWTVTKS